MATKSFRSLVRTGKDQCSLAITLPKPWINFWQLKAGEKIPILCNNVAILIPPHPDRELIERRISKLLINEAIKGIKGGEKDDF